MKKINILWLLAILTFAFTSCRKDVNEFIPDKDKGQNFKSSLFGTIVDEAGDPVENATIKFGNVVKTSDKNGVYQFKNVDVNSKHNLITITKSGYFEGSRVFTTDRSNTISIKNILLAKSFDVSFESTTSYSLKKGSITLDFPADAIVTASNNTPYSGTVQIAVKYLDPNNNAIYDQMPGSLTGINAEKQLAAMSTYGMVAVEMQTPSGQKLQVASGKKVKMSNRLSSTMLSDAPATIPLWYYDEVLGYWVAEGEANLVGDTYVGEVGHFTYWNYDSQLPSVIISGRVIDQNGNPVANAHVWISAQGEPGGGHGNTNSDGSFSGLVAKDRILEIEITLNSNSCTNTIIYNGQLGPFSNDITIPDIVSNLVNITNINVTGDVLNCSNLPVENGYLKITSSGNVPSYLPIENGAVDGMITFCNNITTISIQAVDANNTEAGDILTYNIASNINFNSIIACGNIPDFIQVKIPSLNIDTVLLYDLWGQNGSYKEIHKGYGIDSGAVAFNLYWIENDVNSISAGQYDIVPTETNYSQIPSLILYGTTGKVNVTNGGSHIGDIITGTFDFTGNVPGTTITHQITGSFRNTLE